jgi:hypothetical protein
MTEQCPKCCRRLGIVRSDVAKVGALLLHDFPDCKAVLRVTKAGPSPADFEVRLATDDEQREGAVA